MIEVKKIYEAGDDFVVLRVLCPPLKERRVSVSVDALADGTLNLEDEIAREMEDANRRLERHNAISGMIG